MIYEHRIYTVLPGKMPELMARFAEHTLAIWDRLGIRSAGFWVPLIGPNSHDLSYYLIWDSLAERERLWAVFLADTEWTKARAASEANGPLIANISSQLLTPTPFARLAVFEKEG